MRLNEQEDDPEKSLKKMGNILGVSAKIQKLAARRRKSPTKISKEAVEKEIFVI